MEADRSEFPESGYCTAYVRQVDVQGDVMWALVSSDGDPMIISADKSSVYFFAANHDIKVVLRH